MHPAHRCPMKEFVVRCKLVPSEIEIQLSFIRLVAGPSNFFTLKKYRTGNSETFVICTTLLKVVFLSVENCLPFFSQRKRNLSSKIATSVDGLRVDTASHGQSRQIMHTLLLSRP